MEHIISELERENHNCDVHVMLWKQRRKVKLNLRYCHRGVAPWVGLEASLNARQLRVIYIKIYRHGGWGWMGAHGVFRNWWGIWDDFRDRSRGWGEEVGSCLPLGDFCIHLLHPIPDLDEVFIILFLALQVNSAKPHVLCFTLPPE